MRKSDEMDRGVLHDILPAFAGFLAQDMMKPAAGDGNGLVLRAGVFLAATYAASMLVRPMLRTSRFPLREPNYNDFTYDAQWNTKLYYDRNARVADGRRFVQEYES